MDGVSVVENVIALDARTTTHKTWHRMKELNEVHWLVAMQADDMAFILNHSGGKDSTRMLGMIRSEFPNAPTYGSWRALVLARVPYFGGRLCKSMVRRIWFGTHSQRVNLRN
jgi:hypothetical protein